MTATHTAGALSQARVLASGHGMNFVNGQVIFDSGAMFDPSSFALSAPFPVDTSTVPSGAFDSTLNRAYWVSTDRPAGATTLVTGIERFTLSTETPVWLGRFANQHPAVDLRRGGRDGLAFSINSGSV